MDQRADSSERRAQRHESRTNSTFKKFVGDVCAVIDTDEVLATRTVASVLCHLSRRVHPGEAKDLQAQLPQKIVEMISVCTLHGDQKPDKFSKDELIARVAADLELPEDAAEHRIRGVFEVLCAHVSAGEILQVVHALPKPMWSLWPEPIVGVLEQKAQAERADAQAEAERP